MTTTENPDATLLLADREDDPPAQAQRTAPEAPPPATALAAPPPTFVPASAAALSAAALVAACGGGGGGGGSESPATAGNPGSGGSGGSNLPPPTTAQAARFLGQAQFSASDADIAVVKSQGYASWLDAQLNAPASGTAWDWLMAKGYNAQTYVNQNRFINNALWNQLVAAPDAVRMRLALALSEIFVISVDGLPIGFRFFAAARFWDVLVAGVGGNYRDLLEEVTLNPAMGVYLNTLGNKKADPVKGNAPDENYAREVLQLFSVGLYELNNDGSYKTGAGGQPIETYRQEEITSLAQVFTGYNYDARGNTADNLLRLKNRMVVTASLHDPNPATFFGKTVPNTDAGQSLKQTLDIIFQHPNVGPFIGRQLIQRLVTSNPSPAYVARVAGAFNNNGAGVRGDMRAVIKAVLLDAEARDDAQTAQPAWGRQREPMVRFVQWARTFGATSPSGVWDLGDVAPASSRLGQSPLRSPSVFNFFRPGYVPPNTALASQKLLAPEFQLTNETSVAGYVNFLSQFVRSGVNYSATATEGLAPPAYSAEVALAATPADLVARLNLLLCAGQLSPATQKTIADAVASISATAAGSALTRVQAAIVLTMACPEYLIQK
jgi:uncharacterized protein (DUF1800 family)